MRFGASAASTKCIVLKIQRITDRQRIKDIVGTPTSSMRVCKIQNRALSWLTPNGDFKSFVKNAMGIFDSPSPNSCLAATVFFSIILCGFLNFYDLYELPRQR